MDHPTRTLSDLSHEEKVLIALGAIGEVQGLPGFVYTDGPNGVRDAPGATVFPSALVLAASFDLTLAAEYGSALGREVRAAGKNVLLGPTADILRVPWNGRSGESFGEDPLLSGEMAGTVGASVQAHNVIAVAKHFVANNFETLRTGRGSFLRRTPAVDVRVGERALREIYLEPFRRMIENHGVAALMTSYNRLRGHYISEHREMLGRPRREWGFEGTTFPDFLFAVRDPEKALRAGLDIPGLDGASGRTREHVDALTLVELDAIVSHVLATIEAVSLVDAAAAPSRLGSTPTRELARRIAVGGATLLSNDGILPLRPRTRVALIAPESLAHVAVIGGSASVAWPSDRVSGLRNELEKEGFTVDSVDAGDADVPLAVVDSTLLSAPAIAVVRDSLTHLEVSVGLDAVELFTRPAEVGDEWTASVEASFVAPRSGTYRFALDFAGDATLRVGAKSASGYREASPMISGPAYPVQILAEDLGEGETITFSVDFDTGAALDVAPLGFVPGFRLGWSEVSDRLTLASDTAAEADVAVVVVGRATGEAMDADSLRLPEVQELLIARVRAANPRTVVVTAGSGPTVMPWRDEVSAILHVGQAGEMIAPAVASILAGSSEPGGRLPFTIPGSEDDVPLSEDGYPGEAGTVDYAEELLVGYRGYESAGITPAYPFGHGLGYSRFDVHGSAATLSAETLTISGVARNLGERAGRFVPQVYITAIDGSSPRALRGFVSIEAPAGAVKLFSIAIPLRDLREYDEKSDQWMSPLHFRVELALSSAVVLWSDEVRVGDASPRG